MKVAVINITGGGMSYGYRAYLQNIVPRMAAHPDVGGLLCASPSGVKVQKWFNPLPNVTFARCEPFQILCHEVAAGLRRQLDHFSPDVIFVPVERRIRYKNVPKVTMVQNMWPLAYHAREYPLTEKMKLFIRAIEGRSALRHTDRIIAASGYVKKFVVGELQIPSNRVATVYYGSEPVNLDSIEGDKPRAVPGEWKGRFLFTAGSIEPYRGLVDLLEAMKYLASDSEIEGLVVAGEARRSMADYLTRLKKWCYCAELGSKIVWTGHLSRREMGWCYNNCRAFIMTSRIESFGLTAVEAMSYGCVSVSCYSACLPEIFGDSALYYMSGDIRGLVDRIRRVVRMDTSEVKEFSEQARKRAAGFSWQVTVEKTISEFKRVIHRFQ